MVKKKHLGAVLGVLTLCTLTLAGCGENSTNAGSTSPSQSVSRKEPSKFQRSEAKAKQMAVLNRSRFRESINGLKRIDRSHETIYTSSLPTKLADEAKDVDAVVRGTITQTSFSPYQNTAYTVYHLFVSDVYGGDKSLKGKNISLLTMGGKIKNAELYEYYQQKDFIPADKKLTPEELQQYTVVRNDGFDPAAPGDELVATLTKQFDKTLQQDVYLTVSPEWIFYRTKGTQDFVMHAQKQGTGGGQSVTANSVSPDTENKDTKTDIVKDVNAMVETGKVPQ